LAKRFSITTLGCKVNQYDSWRLAGELVRLGWEQAGEGEPDLVVVNTCAVTAAAARQSRQALRRAGREHPDALLAATGCQAQAAAGELAAIPGVALVAGNPQKPVLARMLDQASPGPCRVEVSDARACREFGAPDRLVAGDRARPFLKVQDGCDAFCTYCVVPATRGPCRSMDPEAALAHLCGLAGMGYGEAVLTGIHLGRYGVDLGPEHTLESLVRRAVALLDAPRLRLSSLEPDEFVPGFLSLAGKDKGVCPHFHLPLQSGSRAVLSRMNRPYTPELFASVVREIAAALPHAAVGADVLAGFPGETETDFAETLALLESLPLAYLHVFPFSPRPQTPAATFSGRPDAAAVRARCAAARKLSDRKRGAFYRRMEGRMLFVSAQGPVAPGSGEWTGVSENYVPVRFVPNKSVAPGTLLPVRVESVRGEKVVAKPL